MPSVGDVVTLGDGSIGVIGEKVQDAPPRWRVHFPDHSTFVANASEITSTLEAPSYEVGEEVGVWPNRGRITAIGGSDHTVHVEKHQEIAGLGNMNISGPETVPLWRLILDNDPRLNRIW